MTFRELGQLIRAARIARGMTQEDASWIAGVGKNTPGRVERAEGNPGILTVLAVAGAVGIHPLSGVDTPASGVEGFGGQESQPEIHNGSSRQVHR